MFCLIWCVFLCCFKIVCLNAQVNNISVNLKTDPKFLVLGALCVLLNETSWGDLR